MAVRLKEVKERSRVLYTVLAERVVVVFNSFTTWSSKIVVSFLRGLPLGGRVGNLPLCARRPRSFLPANLGGSS